MSIGWESHVFISIFTIRLTIENSSFPDPAIQLVQFGQALLVV